MAVRKTTEPRDKGLTERAVLGSTEVKAALWGSEELQRAAGKWLCSSGERLSVGGPQAEQSLHPSHSSEDGCPGGRKLPLLNIPTAVTKLPVPPTQPCRELSHTYLEGEKGVGETLLV